MLDNENPANLKKTTVVNLRVEAYDVYIGRAIQRARNQRCRKGSIYANPYPITRDRTREMSLSEYEKLWRWRLAGPERPFWLAQLLALRGERLGCWCKPKACHGDVLVTLLEEYMVSAKASERT